MYQVNTSIVKQKWIEIKNDKDELLFKVLMRPYPINKFWELQGNLTYESNYDVFDYCVLDWSEELVDDEDKPLKCNEENKRFIYGFDPIAVGLIFDKLKEWNKSIITQKKT